MACLPCERARLAKLGKMAKKKTTKRRTTRRRSVGSMTGKLENRAISVKLMDLLWVIAGAAGNYLLVNPLLNQITEKMKKEDGTPYLGEHQGKILTALKGGGAGYSAYAFKKLPKEIRLALVGVAGASGIELTGQFLPDKMTALNGTGDLYLSGFGATPMIEIPMQRKSLNGAGESVNTDVVATFGVNGTGDLYDTDTVVTY